jgi:hypothetical protein
MRIAPQLILAGMLLEIIRFEYVDSLSFYVTIRVPILFLLKGTTPSYEELSDEYVGEQLL